MSLLHALFTYDYKNAALNKYVFSPILKLAKESVVFMVVSSLSGLGPTFLLLVLIGSSTTFWLGSFF